MQAKALTQVDFTPKLVSQIITFLKTNELPNITTRKEHELWDHFSQFRIEKKKLFLEDREIIPNTTSTINDVLTEVYKSPQSLGKGQNALFAYVQSKYIGINRAQVKTF